MALLSSSLSCFLVITGSSNSSNCTILGLAELDLFSEDEDDDVVGNHSSDLGAGAVTEMQEIGIMILQTINRIMIFVLFFQL